jgi:hypothetical protein
LSIIKLSKLNYATNYHFKPKFVPGEPKSRKFGVVALTAPLGDDDSQTDKRLISEKQLEVSIDMFYR